MRWKISALDGIKNKGMPRSASPLPLYVAVDGAGLQQPIAKIALAKIMHWYQLLACANEPTSNCFTAEAGTPQIWPYFAVFVFPPAVAVGDDCNPNHPYRQGDAFPGGSSLASKRS